MGSIARRNAPSECSKNGEPLPLMFFGSFAVPRQALELRRSDLHLFCSRYVQRAQFGSVSSDSHETTALLSTILIEYYRLAAHKILKNEIVMVIIHLQPQRHDASLNPSKYKILDTICPWSGVKLILQLSVRLRRNKRTLNEIVPHLVLVLSDHYAFRLPSRAQTGVLFQLLTTNLHRKV